MMNLPRYVTAWQQRTWAERWLLVETLFWLGWARLLVLSLPFRWIVVLWGLHAQPLARADAASTPLASSRHAVAHAIAAVSPHTPWHSNCLAQALAASALLRRRGLPSTLYLGVAKDRTQRLQAHAWLAYEAQLITGAAGQQYFTLIAVFVCQARRYRAATV